MSELEMTRKTFLLFKFVYKICVERLTYFHGRMSLFAEYAAGENRVFFSEQLHI